MSPNLTRSRPADRTSNGSQQPAPHWRTRAAAARRWLARAIRVARRRVFGRPKRLLGVLTGLLVAAVGVGWLLVASPWLRAEQIVVEGAGGRSKDAIVRIAKPELSKPLLQIDTDRVESEVLRTGTYSAVEARRAWPRTIAVSVQPRQPVLAVRTGTGQLKVVDSEGVAYADVTAVPPGVAAVTLDSMSDSARLAPLVTAISAIPAAQRADISSAEVLPPDRVVLRFGTLEVRWGDPSDSADKARILHLLRQQDTFRVIDLSVPAHPVTIG